MRVNITENTRIPSKQTAFQRKSEDTPPPTIGSKDFKLAKDITLSVTFNNVGRHYDGAGGQFADAAVVGHNL